MNQKEKNQISYNKILNSAIVEFGTNTYENASLNNICANNNISKGLIYHYFKNKDELFLSCVKMCFDGLIAFMDRTCSLDQYIHLRYEFFRENELYSNIFFNAVLRPPGNLVAEIKEIRKEFDVLNMAHYRNALKNMTLRDNITEDEAIEYFYIFQEMFNGYFQSSAYQNADFNFLIKAHEMNLSKLINIILYGIASDKGDYKNDSINN